MGRRRHYDDEECIEIAHKISGEMQNYPEDLRLWQKSIAGTKLAANGYAQRVCRFGVTPSSGWSRRSRSSSTPKRPRSLLGTCRHKGKIQCTAR